MDGTLPPNLAPWRFNKVSMTNCFKHYSRFYLMNIKGISIALRNFTLNFKES